MHHVDWDQIDWKTVRKGVDRKAFTGDGVTLALHRLIPGQHESFPHKHVNEQVIYIMDGVVDCYIGDECVRLGPGGLAVVPPNVMHSLKVIGDKPVMNLDVFTPARPDYVDPQ
jgi:mannose-6-phosphate isomerase-like protein (cupin superfamily)